MTITMLRHAYMNLTDAALMLLFGRKAFQAARAAMSVFKPEI